MARIIGASVGAVVGAFVAACILLFLVLWAAVFLCVTRWAIGEVGVGLHWYATVAIFGAAVGAVFGWMKGG